jgi:topoisomerase-4 subunit A
MTEELPELPENDNDDAGDDALHEALAVSGMYENWFLDYASYVILDRAVPHMNDGLKPVQRRILHAMREMDDGRFNKVANIIGQTMQYHPHGDASIGDAMVNLGQKNLLIETQGNWGDMMTGDSAAAPRYIEARLSKFALEVAFNPQTTQWQLSYDGRKQEPITLPMKFPLLLMQGVEGIAVGLATKVMPHNFIELIKASIDVLRGRSVDLYPDFPTGGMVDATNYNEGLRGGRIRVRARIEEVDKKTLVIKDIPYSTTTIGLMDSIVKANDSGKIKIKKVVDNTAKNVEIFIHLAPGVSPDITIDALYAFTDCEVSISPNSCVILDDKPHFISVNELLLISTSRTVSLLKKELEIKLGELEDSWHKSSLEKIFIEHRIYRKIEEMETWDAVIDAIDKGLKPFKGILKRKVTREDMENLTEIKIKRISKYDSFKAEEFIKGLEESIEQVNYDLEHIKEFAIKYFEGLTKKYGKGRERKTEIRTFDTIQANTVAIANQKLYVNRDEGFVGYGLKKDEFVCDCSDLDNIIVFRADGTMLVTKVAEKSFVGKNIIHVDVFRKNDERMIYNLIYSDGKSGLSYAKRFAVTGVTRDKEYVLTQGNKGSKVLYFSANPNSEAEVVTITLSPVSKAKKLVFDFDFGDLAIKGRASQGNIVCRHLVRNIKFKSKGASTLGGRDLWYDDVLGRLNVDKRGEYLGSFDTSDYILTISKDGNYQLTSFDLTNHYDNDQLLVIEKFDPEKVVSAVHYDEEQKQYYVKRFLIETSSAGKKFMFISETKKSRLVLATTYENPEIEVKTGRKKSEAVSHIISLAEFIDVKGWKAQGNKLNLDNILSIQLVPQEKEEAEEENNSGGPKGSGRAPKKKVYETADKPLKPLPSLLGKKREPGGKNDEGVQPKLF